MDLTQPIAVQFVPLPPTKAQQRRRGKRPARPKASKRVLVSAPCVNCGETYTPARSNNPYCGLRCHDESRAVRYARTCYTKYPDGPPADIADAIRMKIAHALAGGYDESARRLTPTTRRSVKERDRCCVLCGEPGTEIDHIDGPSNDLSNLRMLCRSCHQLITEQHFVPITDAETRERRDWLLERIMRPEPILPCDGDDWATTWSRWTKDRGLWEER